MSDEELAGPHWNAFTNDLVDGLMDRIEDTRAAALFREMTPADQVTCLISALMGSILVVVAKSNLGDDAFDALHSMLETGRKAIREGRAPRMYRKPQR